MKQGPHAVTKLKPSFAYHSPMIGQGFPAELRLHCEVVLDTMSIRKHHQVNFVGSAYSDNSALCLVLLFMGKTYMQSAQDIMNEQRPRIVLYVLQDFLSI